MAEVGCMYYISIHALLAESDHGLHSLVTIIPSFLSTLSLRRATGAVSYLLSCLEFLSTLSLRRATGRVINHVKTYRNFYPRSPCGERRFSNYAIGQCFTFLSTLSLRRATMGGRTSAASHNISIHALLAESDLFPVPESQQTHISIHALLAESDITKSCYNRIIKRISIHALLAESDRSVQMF